MSDPDAPPLDKEKIARTLDAHDVEYVLIGGLGAQMRGATKLTKDFDICPATTRENLERLAAALRTLGARLRVPDVPDGVLVAIDAQFLDQMELSTWRTEAGDLDVIRGLPAGTMANLRGFTELLSATDVVEVADCRIYVASLDDIILSKETTNRPPDQEALPELRAVRAAHLAGAAYPEGIEAALGERDVPSPPVERPDSGRSYGPGPTTGRTLA